MNQHPESRITRHEAQPNALLGFLRSCPKAVGESHRTNPRHASSARARLAWKEGEKSRAVPARLLNISRTGAALVVATPPPEAVPVLIRLMGAEPTPWIEAEVVGVESLRKSRSRVRLKFPEFCPNLFLKSAVLGTPPFDRGGPARDQPRRDLRHGMGQPSPAPTDDHQVVFLSQRHVRSGPQGSLWQRFAVALVTVEVRGELQSNVVGPVIELIQLPPFGPG